LEIYERDNVVEYANSLAKLAEERMANWESKYDIVSQVRSLGLLIGVAFCGVENSSDDNIEVSIARTVRNEMLANGVWAICESEPTVRLYPALTMDKEVFLRGLDIMEQAIHNVENAVNNGDRLVGNYPAIPSGVVGF
jgi:4-aminobutyrate aminotransferase-like enzyme